MAIQEIFFTPLFAYHFPIIFAADYPDVIFAAIYGYCAAFAVGHLFMSIPVDFVTTLFAFVVCLFFSFGFSFHTI